MDQKALIKRFNLRCLLVAGMLLGGMPFIMTPLVLHGMSEGMPNVFAAVFNGLSVLPASALAFWHRRIACIWLSINAAILVVGWIGLIHTGWQFDLGAILGPCGSIALALCLDYVEIRRWPGALGR
jgi:energy-coupling factor transporter transmembrane protein EcfT